MGPNNYSPVGDVWLDETKHLLGSLGDSNKDTVVDLEQSEELQDLSGLRCDLGDTLQSNDEVDLGLGGDVEVTRLSGLPLESDVLSLGVEVLLDVLVSSLEDNLTLGLVGLLGCHLGLVRRGVSKDGISGGKISGDFKKRRGKKWDVSNLRKSRIGMGQWERECKKMTREDVMGEVRKISCRLRWISPERWLTESSIVPLLPLQGSKLRTS